MTDHTGPRRSAVPPLSARTAKCRDGKTDHDFRTGRQLGTHGIPDCVAAILPALLPTAESSAGDPPIHTAGTGESTVDSRLPRVPRAHTIPGRAEPGRLGHGDTARDEDDCGYSPGHHRYLHSCAPPHVDKNFPLSGDRFSLEEAESVSRTSQ